MRATTKVLAQAICGAGLAALAVLPAFAQNAPAAAPNAIDVATRPAVTAPVVSQRAASPTVASQPAALPAAVQPVLPAVLRWTRTDVTALLAAIDGIEAEGLFPVDYRPDLLRAALAKGEGPELDEAAARSFTWLAEDLRDGRTPMSARLQWFVIDSDQDDMPTTRLMADALARRDVTGVLASLAPAHADYAVLKAALAATGRDQLARRAMIRANMDRWRWLHRDLGEVYLLTNVPEFQLRLAVKGKNIRTYRTVVGKPGRSATPQLAETVTAVVFNPTWTVPQSIVKGEGLGAQLLANPARAAAQGYKVSKAKNGMITVVQQPGPGNALGLMKIDMPNPHAIYLHDTPSKQYFSHEVRAYSHGCIRTERAVELGMTMAILGARLPAAEAAAISTSGKYTKVPMTRTFPVYLTYFTMGQDIDGVLRSFGDIYGRDKPVLASFEAPRKTKTGQRMSNEKIIELDNPL
jgi:murein L,D-transpeptidase YcbB/YkuD